MRSHRKLMQFSCRFLLFTLRTLPILASVSLATTAQPYCAVYDNGSKNCGIPTIASCQQSVAGIGGICQPDVTSQMRPDFFDRHRLDRAVQDAAPPGQGGSTPGGLDWMPLPPDE